MCQLLGMNCNTPTDICFSFTGFQARGGQTDHHRDGWGIAFFEGKGTRVFLDPQPSASSAVAKFIRDYPIHSLNVIAHIRKATQGEIRLENTHPFQRELWGKYWVFAHNGNLLNFRPPLSGRFYPVGTSDSEHAFCFLLEQLSTQFVEEPEASALYACLHKLVAQINQYGEFNFLLSNGERLFAHCATRLAYVVRHAPFSTAHLSDQDVSVDFNKVTTPNDRVAVIATLPLTDNETWHIVAPGTLLSFYHGTPEPLELGGTLALNPSSPVPSH